MNVTTAGQEKDEQQHNRIWKHSTWEPKLLSRNAIRWPRSLPANVNVDFAVMLAVKLSVIARPIFLLAGLLAV
jgi:hypothetical protein